MTIHLRRLAEQALRPSGTAAFMALAGAVGLGAGVAAALLILGIRLVEGTVDVVGLVLPGSAALVAAVPLGLAAAWWVTDRLAPEAQGDGVPATMAALSIRGGRIRSLVAPVKLAATALTLGSGGSAGREGPIVQIGASVGSSVARWARLGEDQVRSLVAAGAGAGIGASFNAPIAGMLFAMEVILGRFSVRHLNAVVVASVVAAVTSRSLVGQELTFRVVPYSLASPWELFPYAVVGLLAAGGAYALVTALRWSYQVVADGPWPGWAKAVVVGSALGLVGLVRPEVLGTGQEVVGNLLDGGGSGWELLLLLALLKVLATAATLGTRASGGAFMPSLFVGASLGSAFARLIGPGWGLSTLFPGAFALVGMAATFAAAARAPLTAILIVFEITGDYGLVLPLMLATSLATFLAERMWPHSVYALGLARHGMGRRQGSEVDLLDTVRVDEVMSANPAAVGRETPLAEVQEILERHRLHGLPVADGEGRLVGIVTVSDLMRAAGRPSHATAETVMTPRPMTVTPSTPVSLALERMAALGVGRLPVVAENDPSRLVGMFRREDAVRAYHRALGAATGHRLTDHRLRVRTEPGVDFFEFEVPAASVADGRPISEVPWPEGCTIVSVRRARDVIVPAGPLVLRAGDVVTGFGTTAAHQRLLARLGSTAGGRPPRPVP